MKPLLIAFAMMLTTTVFNTVNGQSIPPELAGIYTGTAKVTNYDAPIPEKSTASVVVQIFADSSTQITMSGSSSAPSDPLTGQAVGLSSNLFVKYPIAAGFQLSGRLAAKGKPGKQSLKGTVTATFSGFTGIIDYDMKLKRLP